MALRRWDEDVDVSTGTAKRSPAAAPKFQQRKEMILRAAVDVLARKGVRGMTLAEVAAGLDLVPTAVSYYFRKKEDLAAACFLRAIERYDSLMAAAEAQAPNPAGRLAAFVKGFFADAAAQAVGEADPIVPFNDVRALQDPAVNVAYVAMFRRLRSLALTGEGVTLERPERNARTHLLISQLFWAPVWLHRYGPLDYPRAAERMIDILLNGVSEARKPLKPLYLPMPEEMSADKEVSYEAFLKVATELINEQGYLGASVSKISSSLNVTKGSFYHHNNAKDDLVGACFDRTLQIMSETQRTADRAAQRSLDRLVAAAATLIRSEVSGETPLLRTSALSSAPEAMRPRLIRRFDRVTLRFAGLLSDGRADGTIRAIDPMIGAQMITAAINAAAELHHWAPGVTGDNAFRLYTGPLFAGLYTSVQDKSHAA